MLTKPQITSPVGAIRCFSAPSKGVKAVLIHFFLKLLCQLGVLGPRKKRKLQLCKDICWVSGVLLGGSRGCTCWR